MFLFDWYRKFRDALNHPVARGVAYGICVGAGSVAASAPPGPTQTVSAAVAAFCGAIGLSAKPNTAKASNTSVPPA